MKKSYMFVSLLFAATVSQAQYTTPGDKTTYTFRSLSEITNSGVTVSSDSSYLLSADLTVAEGDILQLLPGDVVKIADGVLVRVEGEARFAPEGKATVLPADSEARPAGFILSGKATLRNLSVEGGGFMYQGSEPLTVEDCHFSNINSVRSGYGVIVLSGASSGSRISGCTFTDCEPGAINTPANMGVELLIENNVITNVSTENAMRPFINITSCAEKEVVVRGNILKGAKLEKPGGIGVSNMLNTPGANKVIIENNQVYDCSWGLNLVGGMDVRLIGNVVKDNCWDPDDNGGIAATLYSIASLPMTVYAEGNTFEGNKWGPVSMGATVANFGKTDDKNAADYNPGMNVFRNNSHVDKNGITVKADLCNNTTNTIYAQGNVWNDATTAQEAATTIFDSNYSSDYGPVVFDPIRTLAGVDTIAGSDAGMEGEAELFDLSGRRVFVGEISRIGEVAGGIYVLKCGGETRKIVIR